MKVQKIKTKKIISDELIYKAMTKFNMTSELFVTGGFRKPNVQKYLLETRSVFYLYLHNGLELFH